MRVLPLCLLLFINCSYAICDYGFNRPMDRQFVNMIEHHFTTYEMFLQREVRQAVDSFVREKKSRKEMLRYLIDTRYLSIENSPNQNRLFNDILDKRPEEVVKTIKENPDSLYDGTLLNLPPFFLVVFVGEKEVMQAGIEIDRKLVNSRNPLQEVPLHYTLDPDIAGDLLHNQAKPNETDKKGRVPLYNSRNPETVRVMLYYNADPMVRDRSGVPLIRYHREQVGGQEIVDLLEQARDSKKTMKVTKGNTEPVVNQKTEEEIRAEEEERRLAEAKRVTEERRAEQERAEERRLAEERRIAIKTEAEEVNRQIKEERKNKLLSNLANVMASAIIAKALVSSISNQTVDIKVFSNVEATLQSVRKQSSNIVIYEKELEEKFKKKLDEAIQSIILTGKLMEEYEAEIENTTVRKGEELENELLLKLKDEIGHLSLGQLKGMLNKTNGYYTRLEKMLNQITRIKIAQDLVIGNIVKEIESRPGAIAAVLRRGRGDLIHAIPFR